MQSEFLALICRAFDLSVEEYHRFHGKMAGEIREYLGDKKELTKLAVLGAVKDLHEVYSSMAPTGILYPGHPFYPEEFSNVVCPPVFLSYLGDLRLLKEKKISVVGTRNPHFRFLEWMEVHMAGILTGFERVVVSGGAVGIDQKATKLALACGGKSIVILPSGLKNMYPKNIVYWRSNPNILFISEYMPGESVHNWHFVRRNRLISALGGFLLVVQAAQKSGSMITAKYAMDQGKDIATIPDFPGFVESAGNLQMIQDGAHVVHGAKDLNILCSRLHL